MGPFVHNIDPIFGQIGEVYLWWYGLSYTLGFLALFHWLRTVRRSVGLDVPQVYDLTISIALGGLIGGRLVEVIFYELAYYGEHLAHIFWLDGRHVDAWNFAWRHTWYLVFLSSQSQKLSCARG